MVLTAVLSIGSVTGGWCQEAPRQSEPTETTETLLGTWPGPTARAILEVVLANEVVWLYGRFIRDGGNNPEFRVSLRSIAEQIKFGWEWDDNTFQVNHFGHPYQGKLYYTAARANGFSYEQSIFAAFAGSFLWEYAGEVNHPAVNDWINTSVGGVALGEATYRLSTMILDNRATGQARFWRELAAGVVSPVRALNRALTGEMMRSHANPADRLPEQMSVAVDVGARAITESSSWSDRVSSGYLRFGMRYGDAYDGRNERPFDTFDFNLQLNPGDPASIIGRIEAAGFLYWRQYADAGRTKHVLGFVQHFDYYENTAFQFGNQSVSATWLGRFAPAGIPASMVVHLNGVILGASKSDHFNISGRQYDYGPGLGTKIGASFGGHRARVTTSAESFWIHAVNGNNSDHLVTFATVKGRLGLWREYALGADYRVYWAERFYRDYPDVHDVETEVRGYLSVDF